jgi:hypothetical protein
LLRIEWVSKASLGRGARHELGDTLRARRARHPRPKAAFLPNQAREEVDRQLMLSCRPINQSAERLINGLCSSGRGCF